MTSVVLRLVFGWINERWTPEENHKKSVYGEPCLVRDLDGEQLCLTGDETTAICNCQLHRRCSSPFIVPRGVIRVPDQDAWDAAIHASCHEKGHAISGQGSGDIGNCRISYDCDGQYDKHEDTANPQAVGCKCHGHCDTLVIICDSKFKGYGEEKCTGDNGSRHIRNDRPELHLVFIFGKSHILDNTRQLNGEILG